MSKDAFVTKILGPKKDIILVQIRPEKAPKNLVAKLDKFFSILLNKGHKKWVFDLSEVPFPSSSMIAFFISATHQARQAGGELKIIHLPTSASNNMLSFNPLSFISIEESEASALQSFGVGNGEEETAEIYEPEKPAPPKEILPQRESASTKKELPPETEKTPPPPPPGGLGDVDIVDPPLWDKIEEESPLASMSSSPVIAEEEKAATESSDNGYESNAGSGNNAAARTKSETLSGPNEYHLRAESLASNLYKICDFVVHHADRAGLPEKEVAKIKISVYEAVLNVIEHAYHSRPDNWIDIFVEYDAERFKIVIQDYGLSFEKSPPRQHDYDVEEAVEKRQTGGFGLHIIRRSMDVVDCVADPVDGNRLTLIKNLK